MAIVTAAATAITVLNEINDLIGSQDPLLVRFNNHTTNIPVKFGVVRDLSYMEAHAMPDPWIAAGSVADAHFGASSWTSASLCVEYWFDHIGKIYNLTLNYNWQSKDAANFKLHLESKDNPKDPLQSVSTTEGQAFRTAEVTGDGFVIIIHASGKLIEMSMIPTS